jgi:hypothetical protein
MSRSAVLASRQKTLWNVAYVGDDGGSATAKRDHAAGRAGV